MQDWQERYNRWKDTTLVDARKCSHRSARCWVKRILVDRIFSNYLTQYLTGHSCFTAYLHREGELSIGGFQPSTPSSPHLVGGEYTCCLISYAFANTVVKAKTDSHRLWRRCWKQRVRNNYKNQLRPHSEEFLCWNSFGHLVIAGTFFEVSSVRTGFIVSSTPREDRKSNSGGALNIYSYEKMWPQ